MAKAALSVLGYARGFGSSILCSPLNFGDHRRGWDFVSPGHGDLDIDEMIRALNRIGYDGPLSVEWEDNDMNREHGTREAVEWTRQADFAPSDVAFDAAFTKKEHVKEKLWASKSASWTCCASSINRLIRCFAGKARSPIALVIHMGRRSGKIYETPVITQSFDDDFVILLAYGTGADWYHNVVAAGYCRIRWRGEEYTIENPQEVDVRLAFANCPVFPQKLILRLLGARHFIRMSKKPSDMLDLGIPT